MSAKYRLVQFAPDPIRGSRFMLGAIVDTGTRQTFASAVVPGPRCLGSYSSAALARAITEELRSAESLRTLPNSIGPHVTLSGVHVLPEGLEDPVAWVKRHILPEYRTSDSETLSENPSPGPRRQTLGMRFFQQWRVGQYVNLRFSTSMLRDWPKKAADEISHYVKGSDELLLMEPILVAKGNVEDDLSEVSKRFLEWSGVRSMRSELINARLIAYVFPGAPADTQAAIQFLRRGSLQSEQDSVYNVGEPGDRASLIHRIRVVGESARPLMI